MGSVVFFLFVCFVSRKRSGTLGFLPFHTCCSFRISCLLCFLIYGRRVPYSFVRRAFSPFFPFCPQSLRIDRGAPFLSGIFPYVFLCGLGRLNLLAQPYRHGIFDFSFVEFPGQLPRDKVRRCDEAHRPGSRFRDNEVDRSNFTEELPTKAFRRLVAFSFLFAFLFHFVRVRMFFGTEGE